MTSASVCTSCTPGVQENAAIVLVVIQCAEMLGLIICFAIQYLLGGETKTASVTGLGKGTYTVCFTVDGQENYEQCFEVNVGRTRTTVCLYRC